MMRQISSFFVFFAVFLSTSLFAQESYPTGIWAISPYGYPQCARQGFAAAKTCVFEEFELPEDKHRFVPYLNSDRAYILEDYNAEKQAWELNGMHLILEEFYTSVTPAKCASKPSFDLPESETQYPKPQPGEPFSLSKPYCRGNCLYGTAITTEDVPLGYDRFFSTGEMCFGKDQDYLIFSKPNADRYLRCPSGKGSYKEGTQPSEECLRKPEPPNDNQPPGDNQPPNDNQPPGDNQPPSDNQPPGDKDDDDKQGGGKNGGGGGLPGGGSGDKNPRNPDNPDQGSDGGKSDGGKSDGGKSDGGKSDGGKSDGGKSDGGKSDGGKSDGGKSDGGESDGGKSDGGKSDGGKSDGGKSDGGKSDGGKSDGGQSGEDGGQGSISGGSCEANKAPQCKGDPVQCYIARETWRTACAVTGGGKGVEGGNCQTRTPPECKGDPVQCYMVKQQFLERCAQSSLEQYGDAKSGELASTLAEYGDVEGGIGKASDTVNLPSQLDQSGFGWSRSCPIDGQIDLGIFGRHQYRSDLICNFANMAGHLFVLLTLLFSARYILR